MKNQKLLSGQRVKVTKKHRSLLSFHSNWLKGYSLVALSLIIFLFLLVFDYLVIGTNILYDPKPEFSNTYVLRSLIIAISALLFVLQIAKSRVETKIRQDSKQLVKPYTVFNFGSLGTFSIPVSLFLWGTLLIPVFFVLLFVFDPGIFASLSVEDQPVEMLSALFFFFSSGIFVLLLCR